MRDAAHQPPHIGVAHLGPPGIHSFWIAHLNGPRRRRWKLPRPPTILALVDNQSKILDDSPVRFRGGVPLRGLFSLLEDLSQLDCRCFDPQVPAGGGGVNATPAPLPR